MALQLDPTVPTLPTATPSFASALLAFTVGACGPGPLEPEHPKQQLEAKAPVLPVEHTSTVPAPKPEPPPPPKPITKKLEYRDVGLSTPESVLYDAETDSYLVSNINGPLTAADDNGFISRLSPDGKVLALKLIDGESKDVKLDAPKGMALIGRTLHVTDVNYVRSFDLSTGKALRSVEIPGSSFLNDLAVNAKGELLVSDTAVTASWEPTGNDAVYRIDAKGKVHTLLRDAALSRPNGLAWTSDGLVVATDGASKLLWLGDDGKIAREQAVPSTSLDGLVQLEDGTLLVSSWKAAAVFGGQGQLTPVVTDVPEPADIGYDTKRSLVLVPLFKQNVVEVHQIGGS